MYDMYPWDRVADPDKTTVAEAVPASAVRAVQVALDRRDNGGAAPAPADR